MAVGPLMIAEPCTEAEFYRGPGQYMEVWREHLIANVGIRTSLAAWLTLFKSTSSESIFSESKNKGQEKSPFKAT